MSQVKRNKFSIEDKERGVKLYLVEGYTLRSIAKSLSTCRSVISLWVENYKKYGKSGLSFRNNVPYSPEYKLELLQEIAKKCLSLPQASVEYHISPSVIHNWLKRYSKYGVEGLKNKIGRPSKSKRTVLLKTSNNETITIVVKD